MESFILLVVGIFVVVAVISYLKNLAPNLRKEQIKTVTDSGLVATGFAVTATKDLLKTAVKSGQAASYSVEKNHRELSNSLATSVNTFVSEKGGGNALRAGARTSKDLSEYAGLTDLNKALDEYIAK